MTVEYRFEIDPYTPETIPMERLAEYMADLSTLLGEQKHVHFARLEAGSAVIVSRIENEAVATVEERASNAYAGVGPNEAVAAYRSINKRLREDKGAGRLKREDGAQIIPFPGVYRPRHQVYGPFTEASTLDGMVIRVGGRSDQIPVTIQARDGSYEPGCLATRDLAKELAKHLFQGEVRISGAARWLRDEDGNWQLQKFVISGFHLLHDQGLPETVADLRTVRGAAWQSDGNVWDELNEIRGDDAEPE